MRIRNGNGHLCWWYFRFLLYSPLFFGRSGGFISAPLLATMYGFAAWGFGGSHTAGYIAAAIAFPLPLLWSLNKVESWRLGRLARCGSGVGNLCAVVFFFCHSYAVRWHGFIGGRRGRTVGGTVVRAVTGHRRGGFSFPRATCALFDVVLARLHTLYLRVGSGIQCVVADLPSAHAAGG